MKQLLKTGAGLLGAFLAARYVARRRRAMSFAGRVAIVTGGSRGLGLLIARELIRHGARVALLARSPEDLEAARQELTRAGGDVLTICCDVADRDSLGAAIAEVIARRGRIDLLFNNAGMIQIGPLEHLSAADVAREMLVHFWGPLHAMMAVIPLMKRQGGGRIVNVSSLGGKVAVPHLAAYCASKFALTGLSDALRAELSRDAIYVTTVCPGTLRTGSHVNAEVKGQHAAEYAWFAIAAGAPLLSTGAARAARRIVRAARFGDRQLVIGLPARLLVIAEALAPGLIADAMALVSRLLPAPAAAGAAGEIALTGWDSVSRWAPSPLTRLADRAVTANNELRGHTADELDLK